MKAIISIFINIIVIVFFKKIEKFLIDLNFSWTLSKSTPYILLIIFGVLLMMSMKKYLKMNSYLNLVMLIVGGVLPFIIGFIFNPIYEGDFSKQGITSFTATSKKDIQGVDLVVITIPGCRFCHESTIYSNLIQKRNPDLKIRYIVCAKDSNQIEPYRDKLDKKIAVVLAEDPNQAAKTAGGSFPAFLLIQNNKAIQKWSNDQFGVRAKDMVEAATN